jgi:plasmid stabilization system protein ParE
MEVIITTRAEYHIKKIHKYYSEVASAEKATEITKQIVERALSLDRFSNRGRIEEDLGVLGLGHRYILERHYRIIYRVEENTVYVTDIFSNWQHPEKKRERNK